MDRIYMHTNITLHDMYFISVTFFVFTHILPYNYIYMIFQLLFIFSCVFNIHHNRLYPYQTKSMIYGIYAHQWVTMYVLYFVTTRFDLGIGMTWNWITSLISPLCGTLPLPKHFWSLLPTVERTDWSSVRFNTHRRLPITPAS